MLTALLRDFYTIDTLEKTETSLSAKVTFNITDPIFKGHFPDLPIVPGVCQTQMLGEVLAKALDKDIRLDKASSIKFLAVVNPAENNSFLMTINYISQEDGSYAVVADYRWEQTTFFKFKGVYKSS